MAVLSKKKRNQKSKQYTPLINSIGWEEIEKPGSCLSESEGELDVGWRGGKLSFKKGRSRKAGVFFFLAFFSGD